MPYRSCSRAFALLLSLQSVAMLLTTGCGSSSHDLETAPVMGKVTYNGKPLAKGTVVFVPEHGRGATGVIQADGTFKLTTYADGDGAIIGTNKVGISAWQSENVEGPNKLLVPQRYTSPDSSGLTCDVKSGQKNEISLNLKDN
jgi:hypothetical protein